MNDIHKARAAACAKKFVNLYGFDAPIFCARELERSPEQGFTRDYWTLVDQVIEQLLTRGQA